MISDDIDQVMKNYYQWASLQSPGDIGYPHSIPTERLRRSVVGAEQITDEEAMFINHALAALREAEPEQYRVVSRVYGDRKTLRWMSMRGEGDRNTLGRQLTAGLQFVRGVLYGARVAS